MTEETPLRTKQPQPKMNVWSIAHQIMEEIKHGDVGLRDMAKKFNYAEKEIERHAHILAERDLITLESSIRQSFIMKKYKNPRIK